MSVRPLVWKAKRLSGGLALLLLVAACAQPSEQLWPDVPLVPAERWVAQIPDRQPQWWDASIAVESDVIDGTAATVIISRVEDRAITVHYRDVSGAYQRITLEPGGSIAVSSPPSDVFAII